MPTKKPHILVDTPLPKSNMPSRKARLQPHKDTPECDSSLQLYPSPLRNSDRAKDAPSMPRLTHEELAAKLLDHDDVCQIFVYRYLHCAHRHVAHITNGPDCSLSQRFGIRCEELGIRPKVKTIEIFGGCKECLRQGLVTVSPDTEDGRLENPKPQKSQKARQDNAIEAEFTRLLSMPPLPVWKQRAVNKGLEVKRSGDR